MKRIAMLALAGVMTLVLGACGESAPPKPETTSSEVAVDQNTHETTQDNQDQQTAPTVTETPATTTEGSPAAE